MDINSKLIEFGDDYFYALKLNQKFCDGIKYFEENETLRNEKYREMFPNPNPDNTKISEKIFRVSHSYCLKAGLVYGHRFSVIGKVKIVPVHHTKI